MVTELDEGGASRASDHSGRLLSPDVSSRWVRGRSWPRLYQGRGRAGPARVTSSTVRP